MLPILRFSCYQKRLLGIGILVFLISVSSFSQANTIIKTTDSSFLVKNIADNINELAFSQIARNKAEDIQLKNIAEQIFVDHTEILSDLKRIAKKIIISPPDNDNTGDTKTPAHTEHGSIKMQDLENASGRDFEKLWVAQAIAMHESKLTEIENSAGQLSDAELKAIVNKALSKIRVHRDMLRRIKYKYEK